MESWYKKCMPKIKDVKPHLSDLSKKIKKIDGVKDVYVWGSYARKNNDPNFRIKDLDIIVKTGFNSGDLVSVDKDIINKICSNRYLEVNGYDPSAVDFSKKFINLVKHNIDHWTISSDKKLLHWGAIINNKEENDDISQEAEKYAKTQTTYSRKKINKCSAETRKNWYEHYCHYINNYFTNMPTGWYQTSEKNIKHILKNALKI